MKITKTQKNIPDEWRVLKVKDVLTFVPTGNHSREQMEYFIDGKEVVFNIHYGDIHTKYSKYVDFFKDQIPVLKKGTGDIPERYLLKDGDLVIVDASEDYAGVGSSVEIRNLRDKKCMAGLHTYALRSEEDFIAIGYRTLLFSHPSVHERLKQVSTYSKVYGISKDSLSKIDLILPTIKEQKHIVNVLETWDEAIDKLKRKIEVKENIKKGLMQRLLTNETRLSGFNDEWQTVKLGDVCKRIRTGKLDANAMIEGGKYRFYTCAKEFYKIDDYAFDTEALLISGNGANLGYIHYYKGKFNAYQRTYVLDNFISNIIFTKYILDKNLKKHIFKEKCDGNTPYIKMDTLTDMKIKIPSKEEQVAIANILTTSDNEIGILKKHLLFLKDQKKYLLNNLITGNIRTPETLSTIK